MQLFGWKQVLIIKEQKFKTKYRLALKVFSYNCKIT